MDTITFAKTYLKETSAHGFRYVVEGSNAVERILWIWIIGSAFALAGIMVSSNLEDVKENPISVSIDTVPVQDLPFPAVTMNAAKIDHHYRLIEAAYNQIDFDCSGPSFAGGNRTCGACLEATKGIRNDLQPTLEDMLSVAIREYRFDCNRFRSKSKNSKEALEDVRWYLSKNVCAYEWGESAFRALFPCFSSSRNYFRKRSDIIEIMSKRMRISECLDEVKTEFEALCGNHEDSESDKTCHDLVMDLPDYTVCHAFGTLMTVMSHLEGTFPAGVVLKYLNNQELTYIPVNQSDTLMNAMFNQNEKEFYPFTCLRSLLHYWGSHWDTRFECEEKDFGMDFWLEHMELVYKLTKQTIAPASKFAIEKREIEDRSSIRNALRENFDYYLNNGSIVDDYATLLTCKFGKTDFTDNCELFSNIFSTAGFGYVFNNVPFWSLFKNTTSNHAFYKEMYEKQDSYDTELPRYISRTGPEYSLDFVVRHGSYENCDCLDSTKNTQEVLIALHDPEKLPNLHSEAIVIYPGYFYDIRVIPTVTVTDESGLDFDPETRKCMSRNENDALAVFNTYSQSACLFECKIEKAISICNCSALEYPRIDPSVDSCRDFEKASECFHLVMANDAETSDCDCLSDCEYITYDLDLHVTKLSQTNYEKSFEKWHQDYLKLKYMDGHRPDDNILLGVHSSGRDELSHIRVSIQTQLATKIVRSARVSFSSQVANLGGIIGLFTGMSILSAVEFIYWVMKYFIYLFTTAYIYCADKKH